MKKSIFDIWATYTFNVSAKTITFSWLPVWLNISNFLLVVNMTTNTIIFQLWGWVDLSWSFDWNILTLNADLSWMNDIDKLIVFVDIDEWQKVVNPDWSDISSPLDGYVLANLPVSTDVDSYFWYTKWTNWIIKKISKVDNSVRYATWTSDYENNRDTRTTLTFNIRA